MQRILQEIMKKNNTWNIRRLVDDSFVPSSKQPNVLYCKLTDFNSVVDMRQLTYFSKEGVVGKGDVTLTKEGLFP